MSNSFKQEEAAAWLETLEINERIDQQRAERGEKVRKPVSIVVKGKSYGVPTDAEVQWIDESLYRYEAEAKADAKRPRRSLSEAIRKITEPEIGGAQ
jgi:hypothetical protein